MAYLRSSNPTFRVEKQTLIKAEIAIILLLDIRKKNIGGNKSSRKDDGTNERRQQNDK